jgi:3-oxoacyl-[acyl-carrier-protein] synthase III
MEIHSNCAGVGKCIQVAQDALRTGRYRTALVTYSQLSSVFLRSCYFHAERITKSEAALRYILSDGSGALVLQAAPAEGPVRHELLGAYVESVGGKRPAGMRAGYGAGDLVDTQGLAAAMARGSHHLDQDFTAVKRDGGPLLLEGLTRLINSLDIDPPTVSHCLASAPSLQLFNEHVHSFLDRFGWQPQKFRFRTGKAGYCGGASLLVQFDDMVRSGEIEPGQTVVAHAVEASKWLTGGFAVRW